MATETQASQQQAQKHRKPPLADWPTIKILAPPKGRFSTKTDEWCFSFCSQSISGRLTEKPPSCRAICIRKVFPHEVTNVLGFKTHQVGADGKARYPLPKEGQPAHLPRLLGGISHPGQTGDAEHATATTQALEKVNYWDEGWYFWTTSHYYGMQDKFYTMTKDLEKQKSYEKRQENRVQVWEEYQEHLRQSAGSSLPQQPSKWWGPIVPSRPLPDFRSDALLLPLPPELPPIWERVDNLLQPTYKVLGIFKESVSSGEHVQFAQRVWQKAWTKEPFILASKTIDRTLERWRERDDGSPDEGDSTKGSTR